MLPLDRRTLTPRSSRVLALLGGVWLAACSSQGFESGSDTTSPDTTATSTNTSSSSTGGTSTNVPPVTPTATPTAASSSAASSTKDENSSDAQSSEASPSEPGTVSSPAVDSSSDMNTVASAPDSAPSADTSSSTAQTPASGDDVPQTDHCAPAADWDPAWAQWEEEVLTLVNQARSVGANCDTEGQFGPTDPLEMDPILRCSARLHSMDMYERDFFDHTNPDGLDPFDRMAEAGFSGSYMGENIAYGQTSPDEVMQAWLDSDGHCSNIMNPHYTLIGVGYYPGSENRRMGKQHFWTQNFGAPLMQSGGFGGGGFGGGLGGGAAQ